jgi:hypothetical protein
MMYSQQNIKKIIKMYCVMINIIIKMSRGYFIFCLTCSGNQICIKVRLKDMFFVSDSSTF